MRRKFISVITLKNKFTDGRRKEVIKIRAEISEIEKLKKVNQKVNKIDKSSAKWTKEKKTNY